jgi:hypothetical protein
MILCLAPLAAMLTCSLALPASDWITREKVRGAYFYQSQGREHFQQLAQAGFNAAFVKYDGLAVLNPAGDGANIEHMRNCAAWARETGLHFFPVINYIAETERGAMTGKFRPFVTSDGRTIADTPCPRDANYWEHVVGDRSVLIARLSREVAIAGLIIDPELYGSSLGSQYGDMPCMCDNCFRSFLHLGGKAQLPQPAARYEYLLSRGLADKYRAFLEDEVAALADKQRKRIHELNPRLLLGGFQLDRDDFYPRGLVRGLSTHKMPVLVMPETTYVMGYADYVPAAIARLQDLGKPFLFIGGLWISKFWPDYIGAHVYHMAINSDGYWLFTTFSLAVPPSQLSGDYLIPGAADDYWRALRQANSEIAHKLAAPAYESPLVIHSQPPSPPTAAAADLAQVAKLQPLAPRRADFSPGPPADLPHLRGRHVFALALEQGEPCTLTLACSRLDSYNDSAGLSVTAPSGAQVAATIVEYHKTTAVEFTAPEKAVYCVVADAGSNVFSVQASTQYFCVAGPQAVFCVRAGAMYFYVPPQITGFTITAKGGDPPSETARAIIYAPGGAVMAEGEDLTQRAVELKVAVPTEASGQVWSVEVGRASQGRFEDSSISLSAALAPALAYAPERLLVPR